MAATMAKAGAAVVGPSATLSETRVLMWKARPTIAIFGPFLSDINLALFMIELYDCHLPALFYVKAPDSCPLLILNGHRIFPRRVQEDDLIPAIADLLGPGGGGVRQRSPLNSPRRAVLRP